MISSSSLHFFIFELCIFLWHRYLSFIGTASNFGIYYMQSKNSSIFVFACQFIGQFLLRRSCNNWWRTQTISRLGSCKWLINLIAKCIRLMELINLYNYRRTCRWSIPLEKLRMHFNGRQHRFGSATISLLCVL